MKTTLTRSVVAALASLALTCAASALSITPTSGVLGTTRFEGNDSGQTAINAVIGPIMGSAVELYKQDVGGPESGGLAGSYSTTFSNGNANATIVYGSGNIVGSTAWTLVKDGNQSPAWYLFNLTALGWDGMETLLYTGFWPQQGEISHVALYGTSRTPGPKVPDGGSTVALLGMGLALLALARRKLA